MIIYSALLLEYLLKKSIFLLKWIKNVSADTFYHLIILYVLVKSFLSGIFIQKKIKKTPLDQWCEIQKVIWWTPWDLNPGPTDYESAALTAELGVQQNNHLVIIQWLILAVNS